MQSTGVPELDHPDLSVAIARAAGVRQSLMLALRHGPGVHTWEELAEELVTVIDDLLVAHGHSRAQKGDHPHEDPGDGRVECLTCGKWVRMILHSCKGVPVTEAARNRAKARVEGVK